MIVGIIYAAECCQRPDSLCVLVCAVCTLTATMCICRSESVRSVCHKRIHCTNGIGHHYTHTHNIIELRARAPHRSIRKRKIKGENGSNNKMLLRLLAASCYLNRHNGRYMHIAYACQTNVCSGLKSS